MSKKVLFLLLVAVALLAFAGFGIPIASADCSAATNCNSMFGSNFLTTQSVGVATNPPINFNTEDAPTEIGPLEVQPGPVETISEHCFASGQSNGCP
jgi:hypothetical protein